MGHVYFIHNWRDEASQCYRDENYKYNITARKIEEIYINLGIAYGKIGNSKSAEQYLKKALTFNPSSPEAIYNLAVFYYSQGKLFEALEVLQSGRKIRNTKTLRMLADLLKELNMTNAAVSDAGRKLPDNEDEKSTSKNSRWCFFYTNASLFTYLFNLVYRASDSFSIAADTIDMLTYYPTRNAQYFCYFSLCILLQKI